MTERASPKPNTVNETQLAFFKGVVAEALPHHELLLENASEHDQHSFANEWFRQFVDIFKELAGYATKALQAAEQGEVDDGRMLFLADSVTRFSDKLNYLIRLLPGLGDIILTSTEGDEEFIAAMKQLQALGDEIVT